MIMRPQRKQLLEKALEHIANGGSVSCFAYTVRSKSNYAPTVQTEHFAESCRFLVIHNSYIYLYIHPPRS